MGGGGGAGPGEVPAVAGAGGEVEGEDGWEGGAGEEECVDEGDGEGGKAVVQPCDGPHFHVHGSACSASSLDRSIKSFHFTGGIGTGHAFVELMDELLAHFG